MMETVSKTWPDKPTDEAAFSNDIAAAYIHSKLWPTIAPCRRAARRTVSGINEPAHPFVDYREMVRIRGPEISSEVGLSNGEVYLRYIRWRKLCMLGNFGRGVQTLTPSQTLLYISPRVI